MIEIYTDGGCSGNPGPGSWAYVIIRNEELGIRNGESGMRNGGEPVILAECFGAEKSTTNNRMELLAVISGLEALPSLRPAGEKVTVFTDSQYVEKGMTLWINKWKSNGWKTSGKIPVKNQDLWQRLDSAAITAAIAAGIPLAWTWVKGHAGNKFNERCDDLTQKAIASRK